LKKNPKTKKKSKIKKGRRRPSWDKKKKNMQNPKTKGKK